MYDTNKLPIFVNDNLPKLVTDQKQAYDTIIDCVENNRDNLFFFQWSHFTRGFTSTNLMAFGQRD